MEWINEVMPEALMAKYSVHSNTITPLLHLSLNSSKRYRFIGRFSIGTFIVAPGVAPAPVVFNNAFPDTSINPATNPVQLYHLGLWFNNSQDVVKAGGPVTVIPFNGEHNAGIQILNTSIFPDLTGPLKRITTSGN